MIYFETNVNLIHDISQWWVYTITSLSTFLKIKRSSPIQHKICSKGSFFQKDAKLEIQKRSFPRFGTLVWNNIAPALQDKPKTVYRKTLCNSMFNSLLAEDDYVEINKIIDFLKSLA